MAKTAQRPFGITLLMIYGSLLGLANIALGIFAILDRNDVALLGQSFHSNDQLLAAGIVAIVFGSAQLMLAMALGQANNIVRMLYAVVASLNLAAGLWATIALHSEQRTAGLFAVVFSGLVLYFLFNSKADDYFEAK